MNHRQDKNSLQILFRDSRGIIIDHINCEKVMQLMQLMKKGDKIKFKRFVKSPYFNIKPLVLILFDAIDHKLPSFRKMLKQGETEGLPSINGKHLQSKLARQMGKKPSRRTMVNLLRNLGESLEFFFIHEQLNQNQLLSKKVWIQFLLKQKQWTKLEKVLTTYQENLEWQTPSLDLYLEKFRIRLIRYALESADTKIRSTLLQQSITAFEQMQQLGYLVLHSDWLNRNLIIERNLSKKQIRQIVQAVPKNETPLLYNKLYLAFFECLAHPDEWGRYPLFKSRYLEIEKTLSATDQIGFFRGAITICNYAAEFGNPAGKKELLFWVEHGLANAYYTKNEKISEGNFLNIALILGMNKRFEQQLQFINAFKSKVQTLNSDQPFQMAMAFYYFLQNEIKPAIKHARAAVPLHAQESFIYNIRARSLLCRSYLCLQIEGEEEAEKLELSLQNLRQFLNTATKSGRISTRYFEGYQRFINVCRSFQRLKLAKDQKLEKEFSKHQRIIVNALQYKQILPARDWFRQLLKRL